jgi:hypothetical protein
MTFGGRLWTPESGQNGGTTQWPSAVSVGLLEAEGESCELRSAEMTLWKEVVNAAVIVVWILGSFFRQPCGAKNGAQIGPPIWAPLSGDGVILIVAAGEGSKKR